MSDRNASSTALGTLYMRAAHRLFDAPPWILDDPVALLLLGEAAVPQLKAAEEHYRTTEQRALRAHVVLRSRFAEDRLAAAVRRGITQYIILGAGFDTYAFRQPAWAQTLKIFEVDQPATQAMKQSQLAKAGIATPSNLSFVSIDFEHESLCDGLLRQGVSLNEPTFFSWLGVTMYLKEKAIDAALKSVAQFPIRSEIVFTFTPPPQTMTGAAIDFHSSLAGLVAGVGEPFLSYFTTEAIEAKLRSAGFTSVRFLTPTEAEEKYFSQRPPDLPLLRRSAIVDALL
jgi:methyltransferase (TIGR00027 family)